MIYDNNKIVSTIILDINPSVKITLNKKEKVLDVIPLNDDAKKIISDDLKGKKIEKAIETITETVIEKGFIEDQKVAILINVTGSIESNNIEQILETKFNNKQIECNIIIQETNNKSVENAKKYDISESKASFIEEIIEKNEDLTFEDLKDKSIQELNEIKEEEPEIIAPVEEEPEVIAPVEEEPVISQPNSEQSYSNPPSDPQDKSGAWCTWNKNRPQGSTYYYDKQIDQGIVHQQILEHLGLTEWGSTIGDYSGAKEDSRSSYCIAYRFYITTTQKKYIILADSVTGKIIEETVEDVPQPKYTEQQAIDMLLQYNNASKENIRDTYAYYGTDKDGFPGGPIYRYNGSVDAMTGEIYATVTEKY